MPLDPYPEPIVLADDYRHYRWDKKHSLFGYPPDQYPEFRWMKSLETRFCWLMKSVQLTNAKPNALHLFREMVHWGGNQNGILQKFDDGVAEICFADAMNAVIDNLGCPEQAIRNALDIPGVGLTYASKLLRFLCPEKYGALDTRIRSGLTNSKWTHGDRRVNIRDGDQQRMINGYTAYLAELKIMHDELSRQNVPCPISCLNPTEKWRLADIELALFHHFNRAQP